MPYYVEPYTFNFQNNTIAVDNGVTDIFCTNLYDAIKLAQSSEEGIIYGRIGKGSGLDELGPGVQIGITVELLGSWQVKFQDGNYVARVGGGNLIGGPSGDPIAYSPGVQTLLIQSASSTIIEVGVSGLTSEESAALLEARDAAREAADNSEPQGIADAVRTELAPELTHLLSLQNGQGLNSSQATMLLEIYRLYGLDPARPLVVTKTARTAGDGINQTITSNSEQTIINRV